MAVPMPDARPPPLTGTMTFSTVGRSSDLQPDGALSGDDVGMIERRYQHAAGPLEHFCGHLLALPRTAQHDFRAVAASRFHLERGRFARHDEMRRHTVDRRGIRHRLSVVSARIGHDAAGPDGFVEMADRVEGATNLERADRLEVFRLDPQRTVLVGPAGRDERCAQDVGADQLRGGADVIDGYQLHRSSLPGTLPPTFAVR